MTQFQHHLDSMALLVTKFQAKSDHYYDLSDQARHNDNIARYNEYRGRFIAYRTAAEMLMDELNANTKFIEPIDNLYKYIQQYGVKEWIEAGQDVLKIDDMWLHGNRKYGRLQIYADYNSLRFCGYFETIVGICGQITLNNGRIIYYNIIKEDD